MRGDRAHDIWIADGLRLALARRASQTMAHCLYATLRQWIQNAELGAGMPLPSSRSLARMLGISRNTALAALDHLSAEGFVVARPGAGLYVAVADFPDRRTNGGVDNESVQLSRRGQALLSFCAERNLKTRAFTPGVPALDEFPHALWQRFVRRHHRRPCTAWLDYQSGGGHPDLKQSVADYVRLSRGARCEADQIVITHGAQQAFDLIARLLTDPGDTVWVEEPGYHGAKAAFEAAGLRAMPVPVDDQGMDSRHLPNPESVPRLIYTTPSHQYPRGVTMSMDRRLALIAQARRHQAWIIEDDYDSEFRYVSSPLSSLQGLADGAPVFYVGTFSKVLYPSLRLGFVIVPRPLVDRFRRANTRLFREGDYVVQAALADFMQTGQFARHVARMRRCYRQRQTALRTALAPAVRAGLRLSNGEAGMHLVATLASVAQEQSLVDRALAADITLAPLSQYFIGDKPEPGLVLGYAACAPDAIERAGQWLSQAWIEADTGGTA